MRLLRSSLALMALFCLAFAGSVLGRGMDIRANGIGQALTAQGHATIHRCDRDPFSLWIAYGCKADVTWAQRVSNYGKPSREQVTVASASSLSGTVAVEAHQSGRGEIVVPAGIPRSTPRWQGPMTVVGLVVGLLLGLPVWLPEWRRLYMRRQ